MGQVFIRGLFQTCGSRAVDHCAPDCVDERITGVTVHRQVWLKIAILTLMKKEGHILQRVFRVVKKSGRSINNRDRLAELSAGAHERPELLNKNIPPAKQL